MAELTEDAGEVVEEFIKTTRLIEAKYAWLGAAAVSATSAIMGYIVAERKYRRKYEALAENEISEMREHFARKELAREEKGDLAEIVAEKGYVVPPATEIAESMADRVVGPPPPEPETKNIFADHPVTIHEWDYEQEQAARKSGKPYVIHYDELGESGYEPPTTFTYYAGDDVLCDERDTIVDDRNVLIGDENLDRFGHGSNDPVIVYVRNDEIAAEFEIIKSEKTYAQEVAGIKHADDDHYPRRRRLKFDDE